MQKIFLLIAFLYVSAGDAKSVQERNLNKTIVGGVEAEEGSYPFQVALYRSGYQSCGGSLVDKDWVLSAAHCCGVDQVILGAHDLSDGSEDREVIEIEWQTAHPRYNSRTTDNDYMMIKLKTSAPSKYTPIALDDGSTTLVEGTDLTIMGWGTTSSGGSLSSVLLEAETDYVTNAQCNSFYSGLITNNMMCAARSGIDTCQGDSGGPMIVKSGDGGDGESSDYVQVGITSWGYGCADARYPGVYARVSEKIDWIKGEIANGKAPKRGVDLAHKLYKSWSKGASHNNHFLRH